MSPAPPPQHRAELGPLLGQNALERAKAQVQTRQDWEWERYLSCTHVPHPKDRIAVAGFFAMMEAGRDEELTEALSACQVRRRLLRSCQVRRRLGSARLGRLDDLLVEVRHGRLLGKT